MEVVVDGVRIVFDIGGTNLRVACIKGITFDAVAKTVTPRNPHEAIETLRDTALHLSGTSLVASVVGGIPGIIGADGKLTPPWHLREWAGISFADALGARLNAPVRLYNDNQLAALGEAHAGAGAGYSIVASIRIGTGVGGARIVSGQIDEHTAGFEPGHTIIDVQKVRTFESFVGGAALAAQYGQQPERLPREYFKNRSYHVAVGIWNAILHWSPDVVVLSGPLMNESSGFSLGDVQEALRKIHAKMRVIPVLPPLRLGALGDDAGLIGAIYAPL